ncbi:hypothetical protein [Shinella sp. NM-101]|nr:hypothetical protein [Shinella sp. NM-101]
MQIQHLRLPARPEMFALRQQMLGKPEEIRADKRSVDGKPACN